MTLRTGMYQAMRMATGSAITKPSAKPETTEIRLLERSCQNTPRSIMVKRPSIVTGANGNARSVLGRMLSMYQTTIAARKDMMTQTQAGSLFAQEFLLFLNSGLPFRTWILQSLAPV